LRLTSALPGPREMPAVERLMLGLVPPMARSGESVRPLGCEMPPDGVRLILGLSRLPVPGVRRVAASPWPGCRALGRLGLRSSVDAEGERLIDGVLGLAIVPGEVRAVLSGRVTPVDGVRQIEDGAREASEGVRSIEGALLRGMLAVPGVREIVPGLVREVSPAPRRNSSASDGDRLIEGLDGVR